MTDNDDDVDGDDEAGDALMIENHDAPAIQKIDSSGPVIKSRLRSKNKG